MGPVPCGFRAAPVGWDHGYSSRDTYTAHFHSEMAPNWLDFAALVKGHAPPRRREGASFRYLELGCGMGFGLCLLAALYPEGRFLGVDFHPDHIAHGRRLAETLGLENLRFQEADFVDLQADPSPLGFERGETGPYHYVAAHGIATWVVEPVQQALLAVASAALLPGGLFYNSYKTLPGWLPLTAFQQLVRLELQRGEPALPGEAFRRATATLASLLGEEGQATPLRNLLPTLSTELDDLRLDNVPYLLGEYDNAGWQPLYVAEMHQRCAAHKLRPVATANLPELFEELLPEPLRSQVNGEPNGLIRQTLIDLACARRFRRDLFARGSVRLSPDAWRRRLSGLRLRRRETPSRQDWRFRTSFGELSVPPAICEAMEAALAPGPRSLAELAEAIGQPPVEALRLAALLLHEERLGLDRGEAGAQAQAGCERANARLLQRMAEGWGYGSLAAPAVGSGVDCSLVEALCCQAPGQGPLGATEERWLLERLRELGARSASTANNDVKPVYALDEKTLYVVTAFQRDRLPFLQALGVVLARFQPRSPGHADA
ncbi:class I SAM-dependent methyltransferase [Synechococcus sp. CBW1004]|uniref:class I SAM-dependent methyltransferase n=1 Tax=Synechococcus sp. CBW1004 TaxID=1353136 RepID=UPI0018CDFE8C|nr:class I SAM-dependent methyltransferase [Synechococcus sp. CBW1004]QPN63004.1 methyltransferase regulatory domain-containing protein [Synechococcus sp. CBW1004]